eukprot:m.112937 g.112937  ORF g.112937 m.112937 type:complete len:393 (-) comp14113_c0_seq1:1818-2996(-)
MADPIFAGSRDSGNRFALDDSDEDGEEPLRGWLLKLGAKGIVKTYKRRFFDFDHSTGHLNYFKKMEDTSCRPPLGYINILATEKIESDDPELKRFKIKLPDRTWNLQTDDQDITLQWISELQLRKQQLLEKRAARARSKSMSRASERSLKSPQSEGNAPSDWLPNEGDAASSKSGKARNRVSVFREAIDAFDDSDDSDQEEPQQSSSYAYPPATEVSQQESPKKSTEESKVDNEELQRLNTELAKAKDTIHILTDSKYLLEENVSQCERELELKDEIIKKLQGQLQSEKEARTQLTRTGYSAVELQKRLVLSQSDLAHSRALLNLYNHRLAGAMEQICHYKALADGALGEYGDREQVWIEQVSSAQQACDQWEQRNRSLQEELAKLDSFNKL